MLVVNTTLMSTCSTLAIGDTYATAAKLYAKQRAKRTTLNNFLILTNLKSEQNTACLVDDAKVQAYSKTNDYFFCPLSVGQ